MLLLDTLPMLGNVLLLCFFVFFIFGIVGVQLWAGLLRQRCYVRWHIVLAYLIWLPFLFAVRSIFKTGSISLGSKWSPLCIINLQMVENTSVLDQTIREFINAQVPVKCQEILKSNLFLDLPKFREGMTECHLTPQELGKYKGCVDWNMFYTSCSTGPHNPFHGAVSFDNIGLAWVAIFLVCK